MGIHPTAYRHSSGLHVRVTGETWDGAEKEGRMHELMISSDLMF